jgi:hypothetical protein
LALSDIERSQSYAFCGEAPMAVHDYRATLRILPVIDGGHAFIEWSATFDCQPERREEWAGFFRDAFRGWLESLRRHLENRSKQTDLQTRSVESV